MESPPQSENHGQVRTATDFWVRGGWAILVYLLQGLLAEDVVIAMNEEGVNLSWFISLLTVASQFILAYTSILWAAHFDRPGTGNILKHPPTDLHSLSGWYANFRWEYGISGLSVVLYSVMSNSATFSLKFNTVQLFKTSKIVFVMVVSWILLKRKFSIQACFYGTCLGGGLYILSRADVASHKREGAGDMDLGEYAAQLQCFALMFFSMVFIAVNNVLQEAVLRDHVWTLCCLPKMVSKRRLSSKRKASQVKNELIFFTNLITGVILLFGSTWNGELAKGCQFFYKSSFRLFFEQCIVLAINAWGQRLMLDLSHLYGSASATIVVTVRKTITFALSVFFFPKPFSSSHGLALGIVTFSACMLQLRLMEDDSSDRKRRAVKSVDPFSHKLLSV